jgi:ribosome maturation factor RimP
MHEERNAEVGHGAGPPVLGRVRALAEPLAAAHGLEVCEVEWSGRALRVVIDRPEGQGEVTLEDCAQLSRDLSTALDIEDFITQSYNLEVSSPGLDRPLKSERDFRRNLGKLCKVKLHEPAPDGQRVLRGKLLEATGGSVVMDVDGNRHEVSLGNIAGARLVIDFGAPRPSGGKGDKKGGKRRKGSSR